MNNKSQGWCGKLLQRRVCWGVRVGGGNQEGGGLAWESGCLCLECPVPPCPTISFFHAQLQGHLLPEVFPDWSRSPNCPSSWIFICPTSCRHVHFPNSTLGVLRSRVFPMYSSLPHESAHMVISLHKNTSVSTIRLATARVRDCLIQLPKYLNE